MFMHICFHLDDVIPW